MSSSPTSNKRAATQGGQELSPAELLDGSRLARNTVRNLISYLLPLGVGLITIPYLVQGMGTDRFGILALAWMVVGYFSLFDFGLGRALTQIISSKLGGEEQHELPRLVWSSLTIMAAMSGLGAMIAWSLIPWLIQDIFRISPAIQPEAEVAFYILAASIPAVTLGAGLVGILSAYQRFDLVIAVRIPMGISNFIAPAAVMPFTNDLMAVISLLAASRLVGGLVYLRMCFKVMPALAENVGLARSAIKPLFRLGGWMTVTNIVGPILVHADRFAIGALISATAVAYYAIPYEMVTKLWAIPLSIVTVLFPAFATSYAQHPQRAIYFLVRGMKYTFIALFPLVLTICVFAHEGLEIWLGEEFSRNSANVLQWLALGVFINSLAFLPGNLVQGIGRPDLLAKLHLLELPFYLIGLSWALNTHGIVGAAIVWTLRVTVDGALLVWLVGRLIPQASSIWRHILVAVTVGIVAVTSIANVPSLLARSVAFFCLLLLSCLLAYGVFTWIPMSGRSSSIFSIRSSNLRVAGA